MSFFSSGGRFLSWPPRLVFGRLALVASRDRGASDFAPLLSPFCEFPLKFAGCSTPLGHLSLSEAISGSN
jgi:hypothetical protein